MINGGVMDKREVTYFEHYLSTIKECEIKEKEISAPFRKPKLEEFIQLYDKIKLLNLTNQLVLDVMIVPDDEINVYEGKCGQSSLFGQHILGKTISTQFQIDESYYKIVSANGLPIGIMSFKRHF